MRIGSIKLSACKRTASQKNICVYAHLCCVREKVRDPQREKETKARARLKREKGLKRLMGLMIHYIDTYFCYAHLRCAIDALVNVMRTLW